MTHSVTFLGYVVSSNGVSMDLEKFKAILEWPEPKNLQEVLRPYMGQFLVIYFDDILIYNQSQEDHLEHLRIVCTTLRQENLFANLGKYQFMTNSVTFLGYVVSSKGVSIDPKKVKAILEWPEPKNLQEV